MRKDIKINSVRYPRNGTSQPGFYAVVFRHRVEKLWLEMVAAVDIPDDGGGDYPTAFVICPSQPRACWDGGYFLPILVHACKAARDDGSAFNSHSPPPSALPSAKDPTP